MASSHALYSHVIFNIIFAELNSKNRVPKKKDDVFRWVNKFKASHILCFLKCICRFNLIGQGTVTVP